MLGSTFLISFILLLSFHYEKRSYGPFAKSKAFHLDHLSKKEKVMIRGLVFGQKPRRGELKSAIKKLHIHHLFTPSGLHLSSLLWFLGLFSLKRMFLFFLFPLVFFLDGFVAFKRVYFIRFIGELLKFKKIQLDKSYIFIFVFLIEFIFWAHLHPLSFTYSFLFLGIIYSLKKSSPLVFLLGIWLAQSLIHSFHEDSIILLSLPLCSFITSLVTLSYPLVILNAFVPLGLCNYLYDLIILFGNVLSSTQKINVPSIYLTIVLAMVLIKRLRGIGVVILIFISLSVY
ncbi:MAG: hypothetical protein OXB88_00605 [Bacteriovoracales bacterium]|nr:hypothetical protein [Bacteriovoracales bacterium]